MDDKIKAKVEAIIDQTKTLAFTDNKAAIQIRGEASEILFLLQMKAKKLGL